MPVFELWTHEITLFCMWLLSLHITSVRHNHVEACPGKMFKQGKEVVAECFRDQCGGRWEHGYTGVLDPAGSGPVGMRRRA